MTATQTVHLRHRRQGKIIHDIPWGSIGGGIFWGSLTTLSALVALDFLLTGTPLGILLGIIYLGLTGFNGFICYHAIKGNKVLP